MKRFILKTVEDGFYEVLYSKKEVYKYEWLNGNLKKEIIDHTDKYFWDIITRVFICLNGMYIYDQFLIEVLSEDRDEILIQDYPYKKHIVHIKRPFSEWTKEEFVEEHRKMWNWIADNLTKKNVEMFNWVSTDSLKEYYLSHITNTIVLRDPKNELNGDMPFKKCFACQRQILVDPVLEDCSFCPFKWTKTSARPGPCGDEFREFSMCLSKKYYRKAREYAKRIANLEVAEDGEGGLVWTN